jgi:hypothetical protein
MILHSDEGEEQTKANLFRMSGVGGFSMPRAMMLKPTSFLFHDKQIYCLQTLHTKEDATVLPSLLWDDSW